ncbi:hypothetical protein BKA56DRAFT_618298 [Ilyonectria sp. MPI-CAGE-AT-0026]|nr:hypothetical protein BKA56DRAFT_618298 [Ilyonectria sp. MPI-CAGE-AT-0026]
MSSFYHTIIPKNNPGQSIFTHIRFNGLGPSETNNSLDFTFDNFFDTTFPINDGWTQTPLDANTQSSSVLPDLSLFPLDQLLNNQFDLEPTHPFGAAPWVKDGPSWILDESAMQTLEPGQFATFGVNATSPMAFDFTMNSSISTDKPLEHFLNLLRPPNQTNQIPAIPLTRVGLVQDLRPAPDILPSPSLFYSNLSQQDVTSVNQLDFGYQHELNDSGQLFAKHASSVDSLSLSPASTNLFTPGTTSSPGEMDTNNDSLRAQKTSTGTTKAELTSRPLPRCSGVDVDTPMLERTIIAGIFSRIHALSATPTTVVFVLKLSLMIIFCNTSSTFVFAKRDRDDPGDRGRANNRCH